MPTITVTMKTTRKKGPNGDFNDLATRVRFKAPLISFKTTQALITHSKLTAPQPPRQAWWYGGVNPKTRKVVPPYEQYVRTGALAASISPQPIKVGPGEYDAEVGHDAGKFVNNGTRYMPAQPWWTESVRYVRKEVMRPMVKEWLRR
jgi:hypothetical protein